MIEGYAVGEGGVTQTLAQSGFTRTGPFHDLRQRPTRAAGPSHYGAKAENEHTALRQTDDFRASFKVVEWRVFCHPTTL